MNLREIAEETRKVCEKFAMSDDSGDYDYCYRSDLACMCAVASFALRENLKKHGIESKVVKGYFVREFSNRISKEHHCWVEAEGLILDITATQFGHYHKVLLTDKNNDHYQKGRYINDYRNLRWGYSQNPSKQLMKKLNVA